LLHHPSHQLEEIWVIWRNFRTLCGNPERLFVGLSFTEDLSEEFNYDSLKQLRRWHAEPVFSNYLKLNFKLFPKLIFCHIDYSLFSSSDSEPKLSL
jgi:hypothetical protein